MQCELTEVSLQISYNFTRRLSSSRSFSGIRTAASGLRNWTVRSDLNYCHGWMAFFIARVIHRHFNDVVSRINTFRRSHAQVNGARFRAHFCDIIIGDGDHRFPKWRNRFNTQRLRKTKLQTCLKYLATCNSPRPTFNISRQAFVNRRKGDTVSAPRCIKFCNCSRRGVDQHRLHTFRIQRNDLIDGRIESSLGGGG